MMVFSVVSKTYEVAVIDMVLGILLLFTASKQIDEVVRDERNVLI